jgi:hypothetical protein
MHKEEEEEEEEEEEAFGGGIFLWNCTCLERQGS